MTIEQRNRIKFSIKRNFPNGRKLSEEHKRKIKKSLIGNKYALGIKHTEKWKEKARERMRGKKFPFVSEEAKERARLKLLGRKPINFIGTEDYYKKQAKVRDNYTCQICGLREPEIMEIDHIKSKRDYPELRAELNNLVTLCPNCHRRKTVRNKEHWSSKKA